MDIQGLKDKILQLAIQGKLVQQDENDEPASVLVERINEEKERLIKEKKIRKEKQLSGIMEEEKLFEIPESWKWVKLGEVTQFINGDRGKNYPSRKELVETGIPFINAGHLNDSEIELINMNYITDQKFESLSSGKIEIGDIIYCLRGTLGKCSINNKIEKGAIASSLVIIRSYTEIYENYLYYYLVSPLSEYMIKKYDNGTAQPNLSAESVKQYSFPLPPLAEQKRIVEKIDHLFALIDELDSNKEDLLEVINLTRNQVLQEAMQGKLVAQSENDEPVSVLLERIKKEKEKLIKGKKIRREKPLPEIMEEEKPFEIPESWKWVRLGDIINLISGRDLPTTNCNEEGNGVPYIMGASNINNGKLLIQRWVDKPQVIAKKDDLIITVKGTVGKIILLKDYDEVNLSRQVMGIRQIHSEFPNYLYYFIKSHLSTIISKSQGVIPGISREDILGIVFPFPPIAEQKRIVKKIDIIMDILNSLEEQLIKDYI